MARSRNVKPGFVTNHELAQCSPHARLMFVGLWMIADREGRLEDRPPRIKVETLPYDDVDPDKLLSQLANHGFIHRYSAGGVKYIQILGFRKHQSPHIKEPESTIPEPCETGTCTGEPVIGNPVSGISNQESAIRPARVTAETVKVPESLNTPEVRDSLEQWLAYKRKRRQAYADPSHLELKLSEFVPFGPLAFVQAVGKSMGNNWAGLFPPGAKENGARAGPGQNHDPTAKHRDPNHGRM